MADVRRAPLVGHLNACLIGLACAAVSLMTTVLLAWLIELVEPGAAERIMGVPQSVPMDAWFLIEAILVAPALETAILMVIILAFCQDAKGKGAVVAAVAAVAILGWWSHGASAASIGQMLAFVILALQFLANWRSLGIGSAYWLGFLSHALWNGSLSALAALDLSALY